MVAQSLQQVDGWTSESLAVKPPELFQKRRLSKSHMENCTAPRGVLFSFDPCLSVALRLPGQASRSHLLPPPPVKLQRPRQGCYLLMLPAMVNVQGVRVGAVFIQQWGPTMVSSTPHPAPFPGSQSIKVYPEGPWTSKRRSASGANNRQPI